MTGDAVGYADSDADGYADGDVDNDACSNITFHQDLETLQVSKKSRKNDLLNLQLTGILKHIFSFTKLLFYVKA